jgi:hypothetical protein
MNKNIKETFYNNLAESRINKSNRTIYGVHLMSTSKSRNGYIYTPRAMASCAKLAENCKAFLNHSTKTQRNETGGVRTMQDFLGTFRNIKISGSVIKGDLIYMTKHESLLEDLIFQKPKNIGFSIDAQVTMESDSQGKEQVKDMMALRSCDLVCSAAMVSGLFENRKENKKETIEETCRQLLNEPTTQEKETIEETAKDFIDKLK